MYIEETDKWPIEPINPSDIEQDKVSAVLALVDRAKGERRRADWAYNPNDVFLCSNGHLQYNVTQEERDEMIQRKVAPPPLAYEGSPCRYCTEPISLLTADPKQLQQKLGTAMERATQLAVMLEAQKATADDYNKIVMYLREAYATEIHDGELQHDSGAARAVIYYLKLERKRVSVVWGKRWRALWRLVGVK